MKTRLSYMAPVLLCLAVFLSWSGCSTTEEKTAERTEWKILQRSAYGDAFSYDAASLKKTLTGTFTVWAEASVGRYLYELDCRNKKARIIEGPGTNGSAWFGITGNSGDALLYDEVCK